MKRLLFIYNPHSGRGKIKNYLLDIIDIFVKSGYKVTVYPTQYSGDGKRAVIEREEGYDLIVCSGGDGTLDEVVTGMMQSKEKLPIGYIPAGSTNDFAKSLGIPGSMPKAARIAVEGRDYLCDIGGFNNDVFVYVAAFGMFTDVSYDTDQHMKNMLGHMAYIIEGAKRISKINYYHFDVTYVDENNDNKEISGDYIFGMVTNSKSVGGFKNITGKNVELDDGVFEVTLVRRAHTPVELVELSEAINNKEMDMNLVTSFKAKQIEFKTNKQVAWTLDGEFGGDHKKVTIDNKHKMLNLRVGSNG